MAEIIWTEFALDDLQDIHEYIAKDSDFYADRYIDRLINRVEILLKQPKAGQIVPEFENELLRELKEGSHRIIYKLEPQDIIAIVRVHHVARLLKNI